MKGSVDISQIITKQEGEEAIAAGLVSEEFKRVFFKTNFVTLTLAFVPKRDFLLKLKNWFSQNMGTEVILDVLHDDEIVGGAVVVCNNHYRDYSVATALEKNIKANFQL